MDTKPLCRRHLRSTILEARKEGALTGRQQHIAERCEIIVRGFARVGIIALIDEATGYQADRARDALAKILEAFVTKELRRWVKTFPADFYEKSYFGLEKSHTTEAPSVRSTSAISQTTLSMHDSPRAFLTN